MAHSYIAFGATIASDVDLPLLLPAASTPGVDVAASLEFSDNPIAPQGSPVGGDNSTTMTLYASGDGIDIALNRTGWLAHLEPCRTVISIHRDAREPDGSRADKTAATRALGDRIVTSVIPYLPQLWDSVAIHGSLLSTPAGGVLLLGQSGFGKSTLSQVLVHSSSWSIRDDDTSMVVSGLDAPQLIPMGAASRVRSDVVARMNLEVENLPGHGNQKGAVVRLAPLAFEPQTLSAVFSLDPTDPAVAPTGRGPHVMPVAPLDAMGFIVSSLFTLWRHNTGVRQDAFRTAASLAVVPHYRLSFRQGSDSPEQVAELIRTKLGVAH